MKDEKLPYEERPETTKDYAQRIALEYLRKRDTLKARRNRLTWIALGVCAAWLLRFSSVPDR